MKRFFAILLALILIVTLVGCGKDSKRKPIELTLSSEDSEAILNAAGVYLPSVDEAKGANSTIIYFSWHDSIQNYSDEEVVNTGYYTFRERYNGKVQYWDTLYQERYDKLANFIVGGTPPDFFPCGVSSEATFPMYCISGTFVPVDDYVDYSDPLWADMADAAEAFALGSKHFAFVTDITFRCIVPYNRRIVTEYGFEDPAELYYNDEWTWDKFYDMCYDFTDEDELRYGVEGDAYNGALMQESTGRKIIKKDENGTYYADVDDPVIEAANDLIYNLKKNGLVYHNGNSYWAGRNDPKVIGNGVKDGLTLFYITELGQFRGPVSEVSSVWGDVTEHELMFAPLPRYKDGDGEYYLASVPTGYMLVSGANNPEGVALFAACERFKIKDPTVDRIERKQLVDKYLWTDEMMDMYDECRKIILKNSGMYLNGNMTSGANEAYNHFRDDVARSSGDTSWAQVKESYKDALEFNLVEMNDQIEAYIASHS